MDLTVIQTPCYVAEEALLEKNARLMHQVQEKTGCKIILALKGFAMFAVFDVIRPYLAGTTASSLNEARLGHEEFGKETHIYSPAYQESEMAELLTYVDHMSFNSFSQWSRFREQILTYPKKIDCGIRINPEHREVATEIYDPCGRHSRLGVTRTEFRPDLLDGITGLHFHNLCESGPDAFERTLAAVEAKFGEFLPQMRWLNCGGGHLMTRTGYDLDHLCRLIDRFQTRYNVQIILEPGSAVAWQTGPLAASVVDLIKNEINIAILDTSAATHMPDVLDMPYRPVIRGAGNPQEKPHTYILGGPSCLAGDIVGEYSFDTPLQIGHKLIFEDMIHYTMVKTTHFNGVKLPNIGIWTKENTFKLVKTFGYEQFRNQLS